MQLQMDRERSCSFIIIKGELIGLYKLTEGGKRAADRSGRYGRTESDIGGRVLALLVNWLKNR